MRKSVTSVVVVTILGISGCNLVGGKTTMLSLDTTPSSVPAGTSFTFSASIDHNNGKFLGASWTLSRNGKTNCSPACGTLGVTTNNGSSGNGGTPPYTWTLQSPSNTFPPGLSLNADGSITGTPTAANTFAFTGQVTDSANQTGTGNLRIQVTAAGTANTYTGVSSPGDVWQFVSNTALNQFTATNQTTGALYTGTTLSQLLPNGLTETTIMTSSDPNLPVGSIGFGVELPGVGATFSLGGATDRPVVLIPQSPCPNLVLKLALYSLLCTRS